uniref:Uncharacterized protein n=1 Tax=Caenorhabditis japonica TaxID=281687 RepID=A0A8R1IE20_CAEJA
MFYRRTLVLRSISGANRTSNPLNNIRTEQLELRFVAPDVISPLSRSPGQVLFSPFNASFPVFRLTSGFLTGLHPCSPATCRRLLIVLLDGPGSFGDVTETHSSCFSNFEKNWFPSLLPTPVVVQSSESKRKATTKRRDDGVGIRNPFIILLADERHSTARHRVSDLTLLRMRSLVPGD